MAGNIDPEESRQEVLTEIATNVGQTFLAMTVNCARCHNHKFDPILQADFYALQAVFAGAKGKNVEIAGAEEKKDFEAAKKAYDERLKPVDTASNTAYLLVQITYCSSELAEDLRKQHITARDDNHGHTQGVLTNIADMLRMGLRFCQSQWW